MQFDGSSTNFDIFKLINYCFQSITDKTNEDFDENIFLTKELYEKNSIYFEENQKYKHTNSYTLKHF